MSSQEESLFLASAKIFDRLKGNELTYISQAESPVKRRRKRKADIPQSQLFKELAKVDGNREISRLKDGRRVRCLNQKSQKKLLGLTSAHLSQEIAGEDESGSITLPIEQALALIDEIILRD